VAQFRNILARVQHYLGGMNSSQKLLIASLCVILVMVLFLVAQYAGRPQMVALLPGASAEDQARAYEALKSRFTLTRDTGGNVLVPVERQTEAFAAVNQAGAAPTNSPVVFQNILKTQSWINSRETNRNIYRVMLNNWLAAVLAKYGGIKSAEVIVDAPDPTGFGSGVRPPKASITLWTSDGRPVPQETVDAAARLVAGSVAGLDLANVTVNDAVAARSRSVSRRDELSASTYIEYAASVEQKYKARIENLLRGIDGVIVEVSADVDVSRVRAQQTRHLPVGEGSISAVKKETASSTSQTESSGGGGEPGVRSNTSMEVNTGGGSGRGGRTEQKQEDTEYENLVGTRVENIEDSRGMPTRLVATISIPRSYILAMAQDEKKALAAAAPPTPAGNGAIQPAAATTEAIPSAADVQACFDKEQKRIHDAVLPHVKTRSGDGQITEGEVIVTMTSGPADLASRPGGPSPAGVGSFTGGMGSVGTIFSLGTAGGLIDKAILAILAVVALGMMALMVRKAGKHIAPPTIEEIAGAPPTLETKSDVVGEADETETAMAGIIVGEDELKATKLREQVSDLIRQSPETAVKVLNRWVSVEE
jgi:flagellar M-ring protein FliF